MKTVSSQKHQSLPAEQSTTPILQQPRPYRRTIQLPKILPLWPREVEDTSAEARMKIIGKLRQALRAERRRGRAGLWTYDLNRHLALLDALAGETAELGKPVRSR